MEIEFPIRSPLILSPRTLIFHCISSNYVFLRTWLCKRAELIQIFKALATGCEVGFCSWPLCTFDALNHVALSRQLLPTNIY